MARTLPSTIIDALDRYFPFAKEEQNTGRFSVHPINPREGSNVDTILALCQELSTDLLPPVGDARLLQYRQALATIEAGVQVMNSANSLPGAPLPPP